MRVTGVKPPLHGLIITDGAVPTRYGASISVNVPWADLQPAPNGSLVHPNVIDIALRQIARSASPCTGVRLRVLAGIEAPDWAKHLGGPPVRLRLTWDNRSGTVGRFWTQRYGSAYAGLQRRLAEVYDRSPNIREVAISRCTTFYAEPMTRQISDSANVASLLAAGYSDAADLTCQRQELQSARLWRYTNSYLALNPYDVIDADGRTSQSVAQALAIATQCRRMLASKCVLGNNSVRTPTLGGAYPQLYSRMRSLGPPFSFQLATPGRVGDVSKALAWCIEYGGDSVELPQISASQAMTYALIEPDSAVAQWLGR